MAKRPKSDNQQPSEQLEHTNEPELNSDNKADNSNTDEIDELSQFFYKHKLEEIRPSKVYNSNKESFSYRLSELVFGSLIASYILGFITFSLLVLHASEAYQISIFFNPFLDVSIMQDAYLRYFMILTYILISITYSIFTALIYFNYHQSILYMYTDQSKSAWDYLISLAVAVSYGASMLVPHFFMSIFLFLVLIVYYKKMKSSQSFIKLLSSTIISKKVMTDKQFEDRLAEIGDIKKSAQSGVEENNKATHCQRIVSSMLFNGGDITSSWSHSTHNKKIFIWFLVAFLFSIFILGLIEIFPYYIGYRTDYVWATYPLILVILVGYIFHKLLDTSKALGAGDGSVYKTKVDEAFVEFIKSLRSQSTNAKK